MACSAEMCGRSSRKRQTPLWSRASREVAAVEPESFQRRRIRVCGGAGVSPVQPGGDARRSIRKCDRFEPPSGEKEFQQVAAGGAAEILCGGIRRGAAGNATEFCSGFRILSDRHLVHHTANRGDRRVRRVFRDFPTVRISLRSLRPLRLDFFTANRRPSCSSSRHGAGKKYRGRRYPQAPRPSGACWEEWSKPRPHSPRSLCRRSRTSARLPGCR